MARVIFVDDNIRQGSNVIVQKTAITHSPLWLPTLIQFGASKTFLTTRLRINLF